MKVLVPDKQHFAYEYVPGDNTDGFEYENRFFQFPTHIEKKVGCNAAPAPYPTFARDQDYKAGNIVYTSIDIGDITVRKLYKALTDISHDPNGTGCSNCTPAPWECLTCWEEIKSESLLDCFDNYINTQYIGICDDYLDFDASNADGVALLGCDAEQIDITWSNSDTSKIFTYKLNSHNSSSFYNYFYGEWYKKNFVISYKPFINVSNVRIQLDYFKIGSILLGKVYDVGATLYGYQKRNRDFSKVITTSTGLEYLEKGNNSKKISIKVLVKNDLEDKVFNFLQKLSSTLALYLLEDGNWIFGYYKDFYMTKQNPVFSEYELEINGVI